MESHPFPPDFAANPALYAATVFGMMTVLLLAAEWLHRLVWSMIEQSRPIKHPISISRLILITLLTGLVIRIAPDVLIVMLWAEIAPHTIEWLSYLDRLMDALSAIPMIAAWLLGVVGTSMIDVQLIRLPIPTHLWPTWTQLRRPARMAVILMGISLAVTFLR